MYYNSKMIFIVVGVIQITRPIFFSVKAAVRLKLILIFFTVRWRAPGAGATYRQRNLKSRVQKFRQNY